MSILKNGNILIRLLQPSRFNWPGKNKTKRYIFIAVGQLKVKFQLLGIATENLCVSSKYGMFLEKLKKIRIIYVLWLAENLLSNTNQSPMFNTVFLPYYLTFNLETNESFLNTNFYSLSNQKYFSTLNTVPCVSEKSFHKRSMVVSSAARWMSRPHISECP